MQTSYPYDAGAGAVVNEAQWQAMSRRFLGTGVIGGYLNQLAVTASGSALSVSVATGDAFVEGFMYRNDAALALTIATANATNPRLDTVALRLDRTANTATLAVVTGTPAASPVAPTLSATDSLFEMRLADVTVPAAAGVIVAGNVTDRRGFAGPSAPATITAPSSTTKPLVVKGAAGQSVNLIEFQNSAGTILASVAGNGVLTFPIQANFGSADLGAKVGISAGSATDRALVVRGAAGQTAPLAEFQNSAGGVNLVIDEASRATFAGAGRTDRAASALSRALILTADNGERGLVIRGAAGQISPLAEFQNSAGTVLFAVTSNGIPLFTSVDTGPTATPLGRIIVNVNGTLRAIAYYA